MQAFKNLIVLVIFLTGSLLFQSRALATSPETQLRTGEAILVKAPDNLANLISEHVNRIYQQGHAQEISFEDFFHGHLIRRETSLNTILPQELFSYVSAILYHTAERNDRWKQDMAHGGSFETINHRSIVGRLDGSTTPAYEMLNWNQLSVKRQEQFSIGGTFWVSDLVDQFPHWSSLEWNASGSASKQKVRLDFLDQPYELTVREQFIMLKSPLGRFQTPRGESYEIYLSYHSGSSTRRILGKPEFGSVINPEQDPFPYEDKNCCHL